MSDVTHAAKRVDEGGVSPINVDSAEKDYTIGDLAREFGVTLRALRFYEHRGLISPRREGLTRLYSEKDKSRLAVILKGKQLGFTLTEIRALIAKSKGSATDADLTLTDDQVVSQLNHLMNQRESIDAAISELKQKYPHVVARVGRA